MEIYLNDCSDKWFQWVSEARESVVVFTPFFDQLLLDVIKESVLPKESITLVTQLDWTDNDLKMSKVVDFMRLIRMGVSVRILDRLHAKILIVDWDRALFGSQNFTRYSTQSIEVSVEVDRYGDNFDEVFEDFENLLSNSRPFSLSELH